MGSFERCEGHMGLQIISRKTRNPVCRLLDVASGRSRMCSGRHELKKRFEAEESWRRPQHESRMFDIGTSMAEVIPSSVVMSPSKTASAHHHSQSFHEKSQYASSDVRI